MLESWSIVGLTNKAAQPAYIGVVVCAHFDGLVMRTPLLLHDSHKATIRAIGSCEPWSPCTPSPLTPP